MSNPPMAIERDLGFLDRPGAVSVVSSMSPVWHIWIFDAEFAIIDVVKLM